MKTKFLRFNKLPRIQTLHNKSSDQQRLNQDPNFQGSTPSPFGRPEMVKSHQFNDLVYSLLKKSHANSSKYEVEPRDRNVIVDLPEVDETQDLPNEILKTWITEVCNKVVSSAFNSLSTDALSYEHTKIFCSQGILRNIVLLIQKYRLSKEQIKIINYHIEQNIVPYLKRKYPMTESSDVNKALDDSVKSIDKTEALENDLLQKSDVVFTYRQDGNYNDLIMKFLNEIMVSIDSKEGSTKTVYEQFYNSMSNLFSNVYSQSWMNAKTRQSLKIIQEKAIKSQGNKIQIPNEKYAAQVKEYTHYIIGRKISKSVPIYTDEQINEGHLMIKSPAILRILTKWCDQLWDKFKKKNYFLDREENVRVQQKDGNINTMFMWMKLPLNDLIEDQKAKIEEFMSEIQENNFDQQTELLKQELFENDGFYHIEKIQKVCGKFATKTVNNLHSYIVLYLNRIIHGLLTVSKQLYEAKLSTKARWTAPPDFVTFRIGDLMRCKCSSKEREILQIYRQLEHISLKDPKTLKIIRVKNRLKLGTNDILINVLYKNKYLCQIQLAVKSAQSKFISCSNMFNHYIYELGRTLFGPLTELSSVWISLDLRADQYENIIANEKHKALPQAVPCIGSAKKHQYQPHERPFICSNCNRAFSHTNYLWNHMRCKAKGCNYVICALCRIASEDKEALKFKLLQKDQILLKACTEIVNRKKESDQKLPTYGVCIPICSKKIKIQKFKKIEIKKIMTIYGLKKNKDGEQRTALIDQLMKKDSEKKFLKKYIVFEIPDNVGDNLIRITVDRAKKDYIIPQKVKQVYKKQKEIMSLIEQNLDDETIKIMKGPVSGMDYIKNLQLADNNLTNIKFITTNYPNLQRLQLSRNKITNIDDISKLRFITKLNLRDNQLKELPNQICELEHLEGLNIRNNQITSLPTNFGNLILLEKLESDKNKITQLPDSFSQLHKLTFINLSKNKFKKFPQCIRGFSSLKELMLSENSLGAVPEWIVQFKATLITLDLSKTKLSNFPEGIYSLSMLQTFKIQSLYQKLSSLIGNLRSLKQLCIQMPNVQQLPSDIFLLAELQLLEIQDCHIQELPNCLSSMKKLSSFKLINNKLDKLSNELTEMVRLRDLTIEGQLINSLPEEFSNLVNLRTLSLNNNKFTIIPLPVLSFSKLYSFTIKNNLLEEIPDNLLTFLPDLQTLALDSNRLKSLPSSLTHAKKLKKITYDKNDITVIPQWMKMVIESIQRAIAEESTTVLRKTSSVMGHLLHKTSQK